MDLRSHNSRQFTELQRIHREVKWLVGEKLGYDPDSTEEGRRQVREYLAGVIVSGAGEWLAKRMAGNGLHDEGGETGGKN